MCTVSLANHLRAVADMFRPLRTQQRYKQRGGEFHKNEVLLIARTLLVMKAEIYIRTQSKCKRSFQWLETKNICLV